MFSPDFYLLTEKRLQLPDVNVKEQSQADSVSRPLQKTQLTTV